MKYIMVARHYSTVQRKIAGIKTWWTEAGGLEVAHTAYQGSKWGEPRRLTVVRQKIQERPKATGKQLNLFQDDGMHGNYRYSCYTHLDYSAKIVWDMYKGRADCENRIKEIKQDYPKSSANHYHLLKAS